MRLFLLPLMLLTALPALAQQKPPAAAAATPGPRPNPIPTVMAEPVALLIAGFDRDGDGKVSRAEFDSGLRASFDAIDTRKAGSLGYIGYSDWLERWLGDRNTLPSPFETDRDGDNKVTFEELAARFDLLFTRFDIDKDGAISRKELLTIRPQAFERERGGRRGRGGDIIGQPQR